MERLPIFANGLFNRLFHVSAKKRSYTGTPELFSLPFFHYLRRVHFTTPENEEIYFNEDGFAPLAYSVVNWNVRSDGFVSLPIVGIYDSRLPASMSFSIDYQNIMWNEFSHQPPRSVCSESCAPGFRKAIQIGQPACCYDCIPCADGEISNQSDSTDCLPCPFEEWSSERRDMCLKRSVEFLSYGDTLGAVLTAVAVICALLTGVILTVFVKFHDTPVVKANNRNISYLLLTGIKLSFMCSLIFIGNPNEITCKIRQALFGVTFVFSVSCVLAKTIMVVVAFNATKPNSKLRSWVGSKVSYSVVSMCTFLQVVICVTWIVYLSPFPERNFTSQPGMIIIECNEGSIIAFWCMMGYMGLLAGICFIVGFLSRNLPSSFNEAKFITFSMVVFVSVWLAFIPAYISTKGKYVVAVEIFAIIASSSGLLGCIFFPKCYIILMSPDMNTKRYLMGKKNRME
ncbi:vomeronasal type-2 receptor 26-like [Protopterus annectens]|uniref:vomeronasal type-2 receptor 26-like n=1 Tax=Protopterus annectens TaxID=7888 RepID=UPI001CF9766C|nr:vomeronasal type-2 receptor 26-like [Protopterus annectens]